MIDHPPRRLRISACTVFTFMSPVVVDSIRSSVFSSVTPRAMAIR
ncbi:MAG: hypothetical protein R3B68_07000 [Phycisphaerales bacterium]